MPPNGNVGSKMLKDFRVYILTWNVACRGPMEDLRSALGLEPPVIPEALPDLYAIGFQEVSARPQHLLSQAFFEEPWIQAARNALHKYSYVKVKDIRLQGLVLAIFCKFEHLIHVRGMQATYTRTGLGGVWGNKGAVSVRLSIYSCSMCFVNSHLAAHESETLQRINEYNIIIEKQKFEDTEATNILTHDYSFWFGDLNFRVDDCTMEEMKESIQNNTSDQMLQKDQLRRVRSKGEAFHEFLEHEVTFLPTYKFEIDRMSYNFSNRKPAWTDRILYRFTKNAYENVALDLKQHQYVSHDLYVQSDHKPVSAFFSVKVFSKPAQPIVHFLPVGTWVINQDSFAWYYTTADTELKSWDWIGLYRENFDAIEDHLGYVWASTRPTDVPPNFLRQRSQSRSSRTSQSRRSSAATSVGTCHADGSSPNPDTAARSFSLERAINVSTKLGSAHSSTAGVRFEDELGHRSSSQPNILTHATDSSNAMPDTASAGTAFAGGATLTKQSTLMGGVASRDATALAGCIVPPGDGASNHTTSYPNASVTSTTCGSVTPTSRELAGVKGLQRQLSHPGTPSPLSLDRMSLDERALAQPDILDKRSALAAESKNGTEQGDDVLENLARRMSAWVRSDSPAPVPQETPGTPIRRSDKLFYRVLFGDQTLLVSGKYRLVYLRGQRDILGVSEPFKIKAAAI